MPRKIIHIDMDAFYASIEQRDNPEYRGKPLVVGGLPEGRGGVVATASYEARKFGIRSAMQGIGSAIDIAAAIRAAIRAELGLTASAGISISKFLAKTASDMNKPDGQTFIGPSRVEAFMEALPVEKFFGVGKVTAAKMNKLGLFTGADLKKKEEAELVRHFGKVGHFYYQIARGIDERPVRPDREIKSLAAEDTFPVDLTTLEEMVAELEKIATIVSQRLIRNELKGRTITVKIKFADFRQITRSRSLVTATDALPIIKETAVDLLASSGVEDKKVRLLGISISNFDGARGSGADPTASSNGGIGQLELF